MGRLQRHRAFLVPGMALGLCLTAIACQSVGETPSREVPTRAASSLESLRSSSASFDAVHSFRMTFNAQSLDAQSGSIEGEAGYQDGNLVYGRYAYHGGDVDGVDVLFAPPDLYASLNGQWYVMSPWNQGVTDAELSQLNVDQMVFNYGQFLGTVRNVEQLPVEEIDGLSYAHYRGSAIDDAGAPSTFELWLDGKTRLPSKLTVSGQASDQLAIELTFADYDAKIAAPALPADTRPWRDLQLPSAGCTGSAFAACLEPQTELQAIAQAACPGTERRICLLPLGRIDPDLVRQLVDYYRSEYGLSVTVLTPSALPENLADPLREQVDASTLIEYMGGLFPDAYADPQAVLIGLTPADLYDSTSRYRYVFGVKQTATDPKAVVSTFRMNPTTYGEPADDTLVTSRVRKLFSKYLGLLFYDLQPSRDPASPMFDAIGSPDDLDRMTEPLPVNLAH